MKVDEVKTTSLTSSWSSLSGSELATADTKCLIAEMLFALTGNADLDPFKTSLMFNCEHRRERIRVFFGRERQGRAHRQVTESGIKLYLPISTSEAIEIREHAAATATATTIIIMIISKIGQLYFISMLIFGA